MIPDPPEDGTLVLVRHLGGHQKIDVVRAYLRTDRRGGADDGDWWEIGGPGVGDEPVTWGELNWLDDPACDRGTVEIEAFKWVKTL